MVKILSILSLFLLSALVLFACSSGDEPKEPFVIAGIPDQNVSDLTRRYSGLTEYLSDELEVVVEYLPTTDYAATVTAFSRGDVQMAWFGGLTGVQARLAVPGSQAIAQRERDTKFHSVFVFNKNVDVVTLQDLKGLRFAFGSESSTSGHLMPRHFLSENGIDADSHFDGAPMFSGSHDQTWLLVQGGAADAGALSEAVWQKAVSTGKVDESKIGVFYVTPPYFDYNWTIRPDVEDKFGKGFIEMSTSAILGIDRADLLELFSAKKFIASENGNYTQIEDVGRNLGILK